MLTKILIVVMYASSIHVLADTLVGGSIYFDSQKTLEEVVKLSAEKDNESILKLINNGHVSQQSDSEKGIVVLSTGLTPESPAEFRFSAGPTTYWTLTKFVAKDQVLEPALPTTTSAASTPTPTPEPSAPPIAKRHARQPENIDPLDDDNGQRVWHMVNGKWKWYPANRKPVRKALSPDGTPRPAAGQ